MNCARIQATLGLNDRHYFLTSYQTQALKAGLIKMTLPDKPKSQKQRYRRTARGEALAAQTKGKNSPK